MRSFILWLNKDGDSGETTSREAVRRAEERPIR